MTPHSHTGRMGCQRINVNSNWKFLFGSDALDGWYRTIRVPLIPLISRYPFSFRQDVASDAEECPSHGDVGIPFIGESHSLALLLASTFKSPRIILTPTEYHDY